MFMKPLLLPCLVLLFSAIFWFKNAAKHKVLLLGFACYKHPLSLSVTNADLVSHLSNSHGLSEESVGFVRRTMEISGLGESTCFPESLLMHPPNISISESRKEAELVIFNAVDELLEKTGVRVGDIGILMVNCCIFCPVPSLSTMIVNRFKLKEDIVSYSLHGMGCSAGLSAIGLAKNLLQVCLCDPSVFMQNLA